MQDILKKIEVWKKEDTARRKKNVPLSILKMMSGYSGECISLYDKLKSAKEPCIISEFKRKSPSKGAINLSANPVEICTSYQEAGATAISVLTDQEFFGAEPTDFSKVRAVVDLPLLRKDFILDEYQVHETKAMGADVILLIAAMLSPQKVEKLSNLARKLGLDVLLELHSEDETDHICQHINILGINNRNLKNFNVDLKHSQDFAEKLPKNIPTIAESGLSGYQDVVALQKSGFKGFLMGEYFMKSKNPGKKCHELIKNIEHTT